MRHNKKVNHLGRKKAHLDALLSNMTLLTLAVLCSATCKTNMLFLNSSVKSLIRLQTVTVVTLVSSRLVTVLVTTLRLASLSSLTSTKTCSRLKRRKQLVLAVLANLLLLLKQLLLQLKLRLLKKRLQNNRDSPKLNIKSGFPKGNPDFLCLWVDRYECGSRAKISVFGFLCTCFALS